MGVAGGKGLSPVHLAVKEEDLTRQGNISIFERLETNNDAKSNAFMFILPTPFLWHESFTNQPVLLLTSCAVPFLAFTHSTSWLPFIAALHPAPCEQSVCVSA